MILQRQRGHRADMVRWGWSDSTEIAGYDWIWSQVHELPRSEVVDTCKAAHALACAVEQHLQEHDRGDDSDATVGWEEGVGHDAAAVMQPLPDWVPMLTQLAKIREHIYTPCAMASGNTDLAHKAGATLHQWHLWSL